VSLPQRIAVVTVDTLRFDGFTSDTMPLTHELMAAGHVFTRSYSATSTTQPTHATLFTGLHPWEHGVTRNGLILDEDLEMLPEVLQRRGYWTSAIVASFPLDSVFGYHRGFDAFDDNMEVGFSTKWSGQEVEDGRFYCLAESVAGRARAAIDAAPAGPQFFWFHFFDPHGPYGDTVSVQGEGTLSVKAIRKAHRSDPSTYSEVLAEARALYDRDIVELDQHLAQVIQALMADENFETTVILTSDHGESFAEDSSLGHGTRVTSPQVHVPLAIHSPARLGPDSSERTDVAGTIDIAATVAAIAGLEDFATGGRDLAAPGASRPDARSSAAFGMRRIRADDGVESRLDGSSHLQSEALFYAVHQGLLVAGDDQEIWLADDPGSNASIPDRDKLKALFAKFHSSVISTGADELDTDAARDALKALGYGR
jgi:arylsulfatase A-like enzyme